MSAQFAIPATTFVLRSLIEARLKIAYGAFPPPSVSVAPPPHPPAHGNSVPPPEPPGLNLFLHHAGANPAWRNMYDPHVDSAGQRIARAPLVLDLHYMVSAQGADLEREALLGIAMSALHRNGILPRPMIQQYLDAVVAPSPPNTFMDNLTKEPLADPASQVESITISQTPVDIDLSTKLWSALHSPLRPCAFYLVTTIFLDVDETFPEPSVVDKIDIAGRPVADPLADPAGDDHIIQGNPL